MSQERTYNPNEIRKILQKATEIQNRKEIFSGHEGLTASELTELAKEIGVDGDSLQEALRSYKDPNLEEQFSWLSPNTRIQHVEEIPIPLHEENWDDIIQEIRKETGGIGKTTHTGRSWEWEQRRSDIGYKHFSFSPNDNGTRVQMVSSWAGLKILTYVFSVMFPFIISLILFKGIGKDTAIMIGTAAAILAQIPARIYLKNYFEKQKKQFRNLVGRLRERFSMNDTSRISMDEELNDLESGSGSQSAGNRNREYS